jgi:hypothetical protein
MSRQNTRPAGRWRATPNRIEPIATSDTSRNAAERTPADVVVR